MAFENNQRSQSLFALLDSLEISEMRAEEVTEALAGSAQFAGQEDLVLAIASANNPTLVVQASNKLLRREWAIALIAGARQDRDNELKALSTQAAQPTALVGTQANPLVIAKTYDQMSENELIEALGREGRKGKNTVTIMLEMVKRESISDHTILVVMPTNPDLLDVPGSIDALNHALLTRVDPENWGESQVATRTVYEYVWGGIPADPITHEALAGGVSPSSKIHWGKLTQDRLLLVAYAARFSRDTLPPVALIFSALQQPELDSYWSAVAQNIQKDRRLSPDRVAYAEGDLLYKRGGPGRQGQGTFRTQG